MAHREQPPLSCFGNLLSKEQVDLKIQSLRLRIAQINDEIRSLEEYRNNRYLPVSKLPPDVLSTILESIAMTIVEDDLEPPYSDLLSATQVCRLWRQVALDSPRIWSFMYCSATPRLVDLFLDRSKSAPLHLIDSSSGDNVPVNALNILNHLHRLKEINLVDCEDDWFSRIISQGAPQLESLSLEASGEIARFHPSADGFPVLQHLELIDLVYTSAVASLAALRSLTINAGGSDDKSQLPSCIEFLAILASLPNLSNLALTEAIAPLEGLLPSSSVRLTHLTRLSIQDTDIRILGMMVCITAPQLKAIDLCHSGKASAEIATPIVAAIFEKLPTFTTSCSELSLCVDYFSSTRVELWDGCTTSESANRAPFFQLVIHGTGDLRAEESVLTLFPPTTHPPILHFSSNIEMTSDHVQYAPLQHILRQLTRVTEVWTCGLKALTNLLGVTHPISLPSLKKIGLEIDFGTSGSIDKPRLLSTFVEQLKVRKGPHDVETEILEISGSCDQLAYPDWKLFEGLEGLVKVS
ncbi:hypothetical protein BDN71DRAFT_143151 [Pleurotus eryngii]|uniref:F-box domain-containing protein n=1 Tax=Pleurotus eryngii TaxID=5323 RepID=A0A9P6DD04_PLEER|nr:hypothetical protein BDN71DRAFT_143151 [Pleurotus eryngii]